MLFTYYLRDQYLCKKDNKDNKVDVQKSDFPGITHVDGSARVQTIVRKKSNLFSNILSKFEESTNCPMLLNTSFNVRGEPLVNSGIDALNTFFGSSLDMLLIGSYLIYKSNNMHVKLPMEDWNKKIKLD